MSEDAHVLPDPEQRKAWLLKAIASELVGDDVTVAQKFMALLTDQDRRFLKILRISAE